MHKLYIHRGGDLQGELAFDSGTLRRVTPLQPTVIDISGHHAPERARVEAFIADVYCRSYGA